MGRRERSERRVGGFLSANVKKLQGYPQANITDKLLWNNKDKKGKDRVLESADFVFKNNKLKNNVATYNYHPPLVATYNYHFFGRLRPITTTFSAGCDL